MKPLFIIGLIAILGNIVLGVMNRSKFIGLRKQKDDYTRQVIKNFEVADAFNEETKLLVGQYQDQTQKLEKDKYARDTEAKTAEQKLADDKAMVADTENLQKEIDAVNDKIAAMIKDFGGRPEELPAKRDALKAEVDAQIAKLAALDKEIEVAKSQVAESDRTVSRFNEVQAQRSKAISLSQREGVINAVNPDWAFCIINMGKADGVSTESRLLVKRGAQLIGKLNILRIENNLTVADIDMKSIKAGNSVLPGDQVIFDNAN